MYLNVIIRKKSNFHHDSVLVSVIFVKFKHSFQDSLNPLCKCRFEVESTSHFVLHCPIYSNDRSSLLSTFKNIDSKLLENTDSSLTQMLLYGNPSLDIITNSLILNATVDLYFVPFFKRNNKCFFFCLFLNNPSINLLFR